MDDKPAAEREEGERERSGTTVPRALHSHLVPGPRGSEAGTLWGGDNMPKAPPRTTAADGPSHSQA